MTTFTDIATDAFYKLGIYAPGDPISSADLATAFSCFNDLLDNWSTQSLAAFANVDTAITLVGDKSSYTIGSGGDVNVARPISINSAPGSAYIFDPTNNCVYPVSVIDQASWNSISARNIAGTWPQWIFYDPQFPLGIINVWPTPSSGYVLHVTSRIAFTDAANQASTISLPPGYVVALKYNLARELIPYFPEQSASAAPIVIKRATDTLADLKRVNTKIPFVSFDAGVSRGTPPYNIYTDRSGTP